MKIQSAGLVLLSLMVSLSCQKSSSKDTTEVPVSSDQVAEENPSQAGGGGTVENPVQSIVVPKEDKNKGETGHGEGSTPVTPKPSEGSPIRLVSGLDKKCITVENNSSENYAGLRATPCEDVKAHQWTLVPSVEDTFKIANAESLKCVDVLKVSKEDDATIALYSCEQNAPCQDTHMSPSKNGNGAMNFTFRHSGKCLEIRGNELRQAKCDGSAKQDFFFQ